MAWAFCPLENKHTCRKQFLFKVNKQNQVSGNSVGQWDDRDTAPCPQGDVHPSQNHHISQRWGQIKTDLKALFFFSTPHH